ncbi:hypothetical protein [Myxococcus hansupus]|nr:hypothetical protein [Myxococcus hansupus]
MTDFGPPRHRAHQRQLQGRPGQGDCLQVLHRACQVLVAFLLIIWLHRGAVARVGGSPRMPGGLINVSVGVLAGGVVTPVRLGAGRVPMAVPRRAGGVVTQARVRAGGVPMAVPMRTGGVVTRVGVLAGRVSMAVPLRTGGAVTRVCVRAGSLELTPGGM